MRECANPHADGNHGIPAELHIGEPTTKDGNHTHQELEEQDKGIGKLETSAEGAGCLLRARRGRTGTIATCMRIPRSQTWASNWGLVVVHGCEWVGSGCSPAGSGNWMKLEKTVRTP